MMNIDYACIFLLQLKMRRKICNNLSRNIALQLFHHKSSFHPFNCIALGVGVEHEQHYNHQTNNSKSIIREYIKIVCCTRSHRKSQSYLTYGHSKEHTYT